MPVLEAPTTPQGPQTQQTDTFQSPRFSQELSNETLSPRQQERPEQAIMEIGLEALRELNQLVAKPGGDEHQRFQEMASKSGLTEKLAAAQGALSIGSTTVESREIAEAELALIAFVKILKANEKGQYSSVASIVNVLQLVENGLNDPNSVDHSSLSKSLSKMREQVQRDLAQIESRLEVRRENETGILKIASTALHEVLRFRESVASLGVPSHGEFLGDKDALSSITTASGRLKIALDSSESRDIEGIRAALTTVEDTLRPHLNVSSSVRVVADIVRQAREALRIPENAKLEELSSKLEAASKEVTTELTGFAARQSAEATPASQTPLYGELFGSAEARQKLAATFDKLEDQLKKAVSASPASEHIRPAYLDVAAALKDFAEAARNKDSDQTIPALKEVLCRAADLRKAGFTAPALDEVVTASVTAMVAAQTGQLALVEKAERGTLEGVFGISRRRSEKALVAAFGDDYALGQAAKLVSKYFDVKVLSREETAKVKLAELRNEALAKMAEVYDKKGRKAADAYQRSLMENPWLAEGERFGIGWENLNQEFEQVQRNICKEKLAALEEEARSKMHEVYGSDGRTAADAYEQSLKENPWVAEGGRFGIGWENPDQELKRVQKNVCEWKLAALRKEALTKLVEVYAEEGRTAADAYEKSLDAYERSLKENIWVVEGKRFGIIWDGNLVFRALRGMLESYEFDKKTGVSTFTVPAGVTDVDAMRALKEYSNVKFNRDPGYITVYPTDWLENLPEEYPEHCPKRDYSQARQITITGVVDGTWGGKRTIQGIHLKGKSLVFSDPRDQALAAAIHACKHKGEDLFRDSYVRGSVPGVALYRWEDRKRGGSFVVGVGVYELRDDLNGRIAASGSPSPESKKVDL